MSLPERLDALRSALVLNWREFYERLGISERTLHYIRTGARNPSPKILRRIMELEMEAGIQSAATRPMMVRETPSVYSVTPESKHLDIVELKHDLEQIEALARALRSKIEEVKHANDGRTKGRG